MKKKLALAATLVHRPALILLDEPTTGVDPVSRRDFLVLLSEIRDQGVSILLTTPYLDEAERCDRVVLLHQGRLLDWSTPAGLIATLQGRVFELAGPEPRRAAELLRLRLGQDMQVQMMGDRLNLLLPPGATEETLRGAASLLEQAGLGPVAIRARRARLENVFIARTGDKEAA
jgi:ABC-2 type transport system ATP-binding protein